MFHGFDTLFFSKYLNSEPNELRACFDHENVVIKVRVFTITLRLVQCVVYLQLVILVFLTSKNIEMFFN